MSSRGAIKRGQMCFDTERAPSAGSTNPSRATKFKKAVSGQQRRKRSLIKGPKEFRNNSRGFGKAEEKVIIPQGLLRIEVH